MASIDDKLYDPGFFEAYSAVINEARMRRDREKEEEARNLEIDEDAEDNISDGSLRDRVQVAASMDELNAGQSMAEQASKEKGSGSMTGASKWLLRAAWMSILPFGFIYINLHVFGRLVFPSFFCKLGDEWEVPVPGRGIIEAMGLLLLDVVIGIIIFGLFTVIYDIVSSPKQSALKAAGSAVVEKVKGL